MLEVGSHQAAGLVALTPLAAHRLPRLGALTAHGDSVSELPLLWQLCTTWTALDYPIVVLDACARESEATPGLLQLLQGEQECADLVHGPARWPVLPAARGLAWLCRIHAADDPSERLQKIVTPFDGYDMLMLHAPAALLAQALPHSGLAPLLSVSARPAAQLTAYQALKQLLNHGQLRPTIVNVMDDAPTAPDGPAPEWTNNLRRCARSFLACDVPALTVRLQHSEAMQRLALRCLDEALQPAALPVVAPGGHACVARSLL